MAIMCWKSLPSEHNFKKIKKKTLAYQGRFEAKRKKGRHPTSLLSNTTNTLQWKIHLELEKTENLGGTL